MASRSKKPKVCSGSSPWVFTSRRQEWGRDALRKALEEAAGWWSSHVLLTSAKSCPKLQPRKFPVQPSAKHSFAQADP